MHPRLASDSDGISAEERLDILDLIGRYLFAVDSGAENDVLSCFSKDGEVIYSTGETFRGAHGLTMFARKAIGGEECLGRMHINLPLFFRRDGDAVILTSYLSTAIWQLPQPPQSFGSLRLIEDTCIRDGDHWKIATRRISIWNSETVKELRRGSGRSTSAATA